ncbi:MAG: amino acid decarboxylase [Acidiphilium sp. 37-64-53]|uniref:Orn/Lys/Arg family decarboxylase n=1 Tax=Acidiphilium TaxID=522 RepID=UPI000BDD647A|nr:MULTISPECIES: Orn/Lys/Arg decarboxylase N-terminal domain-containing protein [Acidiphilium]OYW00578.1 MAG: amino acid decarboxylase [Acidiphilium sp. 37-64-53]OZB25948.1 MAG: amino acid decarboxylase [Acidiphilium sp. 34-64-41]HQT86462.1 Orn/Lys/Arg decarboxylase N-terminal domain-containing protein [Acidiphilium rubrum]
MSFDTLFGILACSAILHEESHEACHLRDILGEVTRRGYAVTETATVADAEASMRTDSAIGCVLLEWGDGAWRSETDALIGTIRARGLEMPIFLLVRRHRLDEIPVEVLGKVTGYLFLAEDMPDFIAKNLIGHLKIYAATLKTPFFGAMVDFAEEGNQVWTCPGHNGGIFYWKSPVGRLFVEHLGEAIFRNDLDNSVVELGDLLTHEGPALQAQREAAVIFGADRTYFVLNGTSTSNKIALGALVAHGDLVLFDRNNHKSIHHGALINAGGIPVYLPTDRNPQGLIGPIDFASLDEAAIRARIEAHPLVTDPAAARAAKPFRVAVIEQCSYDGTIYSAEMIYRKLSPLCDYILFDEAWAGFMKFHPLFVGRFAMGLAGMGADDAGIIATQSTHKQLAGFSQASQIHVKDHHIAGQRRQVTHKRFNETFMLHASTSPFYPLFASLDVGAQMMKGRAGHVMWDDTIRLGIELRKKLRALSDEFAAAARHPAEAWFFDPFVPDRIPAAGDDAQGMIRWQDAPTDRLASDPACWALEPGAAWHGFTHLAPGYAMTDPNKLTLITPGLSRVDGSYEDHGIPAAILAEYLRENRIVPEKNDLNSILFLLTPGMESSKAGTLLSALVGFKRLHDVNAPLIEVLPDFTARHGARYAKIGLYDLCHDMHQFYRAHDVSALQRDQFRAAHFPEIVMSPQEAMQHFIRNDVDYLPLDQLSGRIAATLALVYPPGIGVIVPGERYDEHARPMVDYLRMFEAAANRFPGFESEIQGVYRETQDDGSVKLFTYVVRQ